MGASKDGLAVPGAGAKVVEKVGDAVADLGAWNEKPVASFAEGDLTFAVAENGEVGALLLSPPIVKLKLEGL